MAFFLYKKNQDASTEAPAHKISRKLFAEIPAIASTRKIGNRALQLLSDESFQEIKLRLRPFDDRPRSKKYVVLPVRDWKENLLLSYPIADQRSNPAY